MAIKRVLSGVQPSGAQVHIGNYLGAMKRFVTLAKDFDTVFCLVDLHALTTVEISDHLRDYTTSLAAAYLAIGLDPSKTILFRQSDVPEVCELAWYLSCHFSAGLLERAHKVKDFRAKDVNFNAGVMFYPILMAADILLYRANLIPVGADQKQHIEMCRDVAIKFNGTYEKEVFVIPEPLIDAQTSVIVGVDGRKMSKSYDNYIGLFEEPKVLKEKVMKIVTDSKGLDESKDPDNCNIFQLYKHLATKDEAAALAERYRKGGMGYGHAKQELLTVIEREISPLRDNYNKWIARKSDLVDVLKAGAIRARAIAEPQMDLVRSTVGVR